MYGVGSWNFNEKDYVSYENKAYKFPAAKPCVKRGLNLTKIEFYTFGSCNMKYLFFPWCKDPAKNYGIDIYSLELRYIYIYVGLNWKILVITWFNLEILWFLIKFNGLFIAPYWTQMNWIYVIRVSCKIGYYFDNLNTATLTHVRYNHDITYLLVYSKPV